MDDTTALRAIDSPADCKRCEDVQRRAFAYADIDVVPKNELLQIARSGGLVLGAFAREPALGAAERLVGFCFGFVGRDADGAIYHSSRMVAVVPEARRRGLAERLKRAQAEHVRAQGIVEIRWTFDPLAAANASLNLGKLGAAATGYARDYYGATSSPLHRHGTDRLLVRWRLDRPRAQAPEGAERIEIGEAADLARVRSQFESALARGLVGVDFREGAYLLAPRGDRGS